MLWGERRGQGIIVAGNNRRGCPMPQPNDLSRSLAALDQDSTLIAVIEISQSSWLVAGLVPGINRQPLKKLAADETALVQLLYRWRDEATKAGRAIDRIAVAYEAGRDGFWLARWLRGQGIEAHVIHPTSVAVSQASPGEEGPARYRTVDARLPRLAARRAAPLPHGDDPDACRGRCQ